MDYSGNVKVRDRLISFANDYLVNPYVNNLKRKGFVREEFTVESYQILFRGMEVLKINLTEKWNFVIF